MTGSTAYNNILISVQICSDFQINTTQLDP